MFKTTRVFYKQMAKSNNISYSLTQNFVVVRKLKFKTCFASQF